MKIHWGVVAAMALLAGPAPGFADEDDGIEFELFFEDAEMVTSAVRHPQPLHLSPSAVTVLTREDIEASGARTLPEVLRLVPNMDIAVVKPFWYMVGVRGLASLNADTMLLLVDGRDLTIEFFGFTAWSAQHVSMDDVERIEVIRGPGSALYGANAYTGVVSVITRRADSEPGSLASVRGGERGALELSLRATRKLGQVALGITAGLMREDFWTERGRNGKSLVRGRLDTAVPLWGDVRLVVEAGALGTTGTLFTDGGTVDIDDIVNLYGLARFEWHELSVQALFDHSDILTDMNMDLRYEGLDLGRLRATDARVNKWAIQAQHTLQIFHNRFTYGVEWIYNDYHSSVMVEQHTYEHRAGFFAQDEVDLSSMLKELGGWDVPPLILTAGLRLDLNSITSSEVSPRVALVFSPVPDHSLRLGYAHAFLKPTFFESSLHVELESDLGIDRLNLGNPEMHNEQIDSIELGYLGTFLDGRLQVKLDLAYTWYRNIIEFYLDWDAMQYLSVSGFRVPDINGPGIGWRNNPEMMHGHDVELVLTARPTNHTRVFFQAGYRQIFDEEDNLFIKAEPVWRLAAGADVRFSEDLTVSARAFYVAGRYRGVGDPDGMLEPTRRLYLPEAWFLNARAAWRVVGQPMEIETGVEIFNLLGFAFREYAGFAVPNAQDHGGEMLGRRVVLFLQGKI